MRKIVVITFVSLDGVMQAPGGPEEDTSGGFKYGGWIAPYDDDDFNAALKKDMEPADILLGRKTFEIWENFWPQHEKEWPGINNVTKYVVSKNRNKSEWKNSVFLKDVEDIRKLKAADGPEIHVWGSANLIQSLLANDLVDELRLKTFPLLLGKGKKLFDSGTIPAAFKLADTRITADGVIFATYKRDGDVKTGHVGVRSDD